MLKRFSLALAAAMLVAGCSSGVDLEGKAPIEDGTATAIPTQNLGLNGAQSGSAGLSGVAGVNLSQSGANGAGPVGISRLVYFD